MTRYLDTSVLVAAFTNEARTGTIQSWLGKQKPDTLAISDWAVTEFSAALSIKLRTGQIAERDRADALALFTRTADDSFEVLPVQAAQFRTAARFADQYTLGLRAGDALHLAIAADNGAVLVTLDERLAKGGSAAGVRTLLL
ncbi:MAG TPA: type II toxin-antitoxin system VapC family toxin [Rhizomicrobium sp.]|nr:type II toxin-antitoxin system VapC family toxin [Rhizomicrobium sp.]